MSVLTIAGDLAPLRRNLAVFESRPLRSLVDLGLSPSGGMVVANLECPLSDSSVPIVKGGPAIRIPTRFAGAIREFGIAAVTLANNHILDFGAEGLDETIESLSREGIRWFGAGATLSEAAKPLAMDHENSRFEFFGFAENEYNCSTAQTPGALPLEVSTLVRTLNGVSGNPFVVVLFHAGNEYFEYPSPWLRDTCRLAVELGAKVVVCQHSHCIGSYEVYAGGLIVYGQGNFVFDIGNDKPAWLNGLLVQLNVEDGALKEFRFVPFRQDPGGGMVAPLEPGPGDELLATFEERSKVLLDEELFLNKWDAYCEQNRRTYQSHLFGLGKLTRRANRLLGFCDLVPRKGQRNIGNALRCQSHLEVLRHLYSREKTC
jgi:poly-gamma-glutamate synthesis protein (capsule biosynthesis protein)